ncbi:aldolase-type TIM barrel family protein isoform 1 [Tanacetum coccineum]
MSAHLHQQQRKQMGSKEIDTRTMNGVREDEGGFSARVGATENHIPNWTHAEWLGLPLLFKSSFEKANMTSSKSFRGPGLAKGSKGSAIWEDEVKMCTDDGLEGSIGDGYSWRNYRQRHFRCQISKVTDLAILSAISEQTPKCSREATWHQNNKSLYVLQGLESRGLNVIQSTIIKKKEAGSEGEYKSEQ